MQGLRKLVLAAVLLLLAPTAVVGYQLAQVADAKGCPARLVPGPGPVPLRLFFQHDAQAAVFDARALTSYLADRTGRTFHVAGTEHADETGFRLAAAARPLSREVLVFLAFTPSFPNVPTSHGMVDALGFATPGTACAYVSFLPSQPVVCRLEASVQPLQPAYAYVAHELGHLMGLAHTLGGLMGRGVFKLCGDDRFTEAQRAELQRWGS